jgi:hypothetical protein
MAYYTGAIIGRKQLTVVKMIEKRKLASSSEKLGKSVRTSLAMKRASSQTTVTGGLLWILA